MTEYRLISEEDYNNITDEFEGVHVLKQELRLDYFDYLPKIDIEEIRKVCEAVNGLGLADKEAQNTLNNLPKKEAVELSKTVIGCSDCSVCSGCKWLQ